MDESKRDFLKKAGLSILGLGAVGTASSAIAKGAFRTAANSKKATRWAMFIDAERCAAQGACDACVRACHEAHNVPTEIKEPRHEIKWLWKEEHKHVFPMQTHDWSKESLKHRKTLVLCNHCANAPCVRVCPTQATWKRADGIVMMDMHRCIGCRYCVVACPYGARSFNFKDPVPHIPEESYTHLYPTRMKGVVEKCNFCAERLARGEEPACVVACREKGAGALVFGDLEKEGDPVREAIENNNTIRRKPTLGTKPHVFYKV
jgi:Fe-S-cluster-containing dehydrogenase component